MPPKKKKKKKDNEPVVIQFGDIEATNIAFDHKEKQAFILDGPPGKFLVIAWDIDPSGYGYWRVKVVGTKNGKPVTTQLEPGNEQVAFYGDTAILGANKTELFASYSYEDDDQRDNDGIVINKVKEVLIRPKRDD